MPAKVVMVSRRDSLPSKRFRQIGELVFLWAAIEHELVDLIGEALQLDMKTRRIFMAKMDPKARIALLKVVRSRYIRMPKTRGRIRDLESACRSLYKTRNMFAHGAWVYPDGEPDVAELLCAADGDDTYLPKRMSVTDASLEKVVEHYRSCLGHAKAIRQLVALEVSQGQ